MGKSGSSSQADQTTKTENYDQRIVNESGIVAASGSSLVANIESIDGDVVNRALEFATASDASNAAGFGKLLDFAAKAFDTGASVIKTGQDQVLSAAQSVQNDKNGAIDQKTIVVLGIAAAAALVIVKGNK